jgi:phage protein D
VLLEETTGATDGSRQPSERAPPVAQHIELPDVINEERKPEPVRRTRAEETKSSGPIRKADAEPVLPLKASIEQGQVEGILERIAIGRNDQVAVCDLELSLEGRAIDTGEHGAFPVEQLRSRDLRVDPAQLKLAGAKIGSLTATATRT